MVYRVGKYSGDNMINWILLIILTIWIFGSDIILRKIFVNKDPEIEKLNRQIALLKGLKVKSLDQQKQYLELIEKRNNNIDTGFMKFVFMIIMFIAYSIILDYINLKYFIPSVFIFSLLIPFVYIKVSKNLKNKMFNYFSMFTMFVFFTGYLAADRYLPFYINGIRIQFIYLLPVYMIINMVITYFREKIFKDKLLQSIKG